MSVERSPAGSGRGGALPKEIVIRGYNLFSITTSPERQAAVAKFIFDNLETGRLNATVSTTFPFDQIVEAHRELERNRHIGLIVVTV